MQDRVWLLPEPCSSPLSVTSVLQAQTRKTDLHTANYSAAWCIGVYVQSLPRRRPEQSARRESFGMVSHGGKVQHRRRDKLMLKEHFVGFITAQVVVAVSFQKGQLIIEVDERRVFHDKTWCESDSRWAVTSNSVGTKKDDNLQTVSGSRIYSSQPRGKMCWQRRNGMKCRILVLP